VIAVGSTRSTAQVPRTSGEVSQPRRPDCLNLLAVAAGSDTNVTSRGSTTGVSGPTGTATADVHEPLVADRGAEPSAAAAVP
jgi:hypothetical protein